jgi:enamine deaminase RidA (YjgF/YER057c/UK114 family)
MIKRSGPYAGLLHEVVEHNGILHFAGVVSEDAALDMAGQTFSVTRQIDALLAAHGSDKSRLLTALIFVTDMKQKPAMNKVGRPGSGRPTCRPGRPSGLRTLTAT